MECLAHVCVRRKHASGSISEFTRCDRLIIISSLILNLILWYSVHVLGFQGEAAEVGSRRFREPAH
jgi:hypothetical protein